MHELSFKSDVLPLKNQLFRLALRITLSQQEAEDIVQDTLIKIWSKRDHWAEIESMEAYALRICRNLSLDRLKLRENQNVSLDNSTIERTDNSANPHEALLRSERMMRIRRIMDTLSEKQRTCMQLRDFEGKSYKEISNILEIPEEQVKINIFRARKAVKERFLKEEKL